MTSVSLIGTYQVEVSPEERQHITEHVTGDEAQTEREIADLVLLELLVSNATQDFDVGLVGQQGSDQAPWLERYFSADGQLCLGEKQPTLTEFRVCFFMHNFRTGSPVQSPYGNIASLDITSMPARLASACTYEHPG